MKATKDDVRAVINALLDSVDGYVLCKVWDSEDDYEAGNTENIVGVRFYDGDYYFIDKDDWTWNYATLYTEKI